MQICFQFIVKMLMNTHLFLKKKKKNNHKLAMAAKSQKLKFIKNTGTKII